MGDRWFEDLIALMDDIHDPSPRPDEDWKQSISPTPPGIGDPPVGGVPHSFSRPSGFQHGAIGTAGGYAGAGGGAGYRTDLPGRTPWS